MGDTTIGWLSDLDAKYTPSSTQFDAARGHRASIESRLDSDLGAREMFEIGSLRHGTGAWIYSDADYLVSLKGIRPESIWTMLEKGMSSLESRFPSTTISSRRPAVVCKFLGWNSRNRAGLPANDWLLDRASFRGGGWSHIPRTTTRTSTG